MEKLTRRSFIGGLIAAPAIVAYGNIMPVRKLIVTAEDMPTAMALLRQEIETWGHFEKAWVFKAIGGQQIAAEINNTLTPVTITCNGVVYKNPELS